MKHLGGFTIIELLFTMTVAAILLSLTVDMTGLIADNRRSAAVNEFLAAVNYARSEAVTRTTNVTICRSANGTSCAATGGWEQGWIIFVDRGTLGEVGGVADGDDANQNPDGVDVDKDGDVDASDVAVNFPLKRHGALPPGVTLRDPSDTIAASLSFGLTGGAIGSNGRLIVCDSRGYGGPPNYKARWIEVSAGGRTRSLKPTSVVSCT